MRDLYGERTHFIYEILQNTEDALNKLYKRFRSRAIKFSLTSDQLVASHFGKPFDEADVTSICGIGESAKKELTDIGRFGIGFKSVYAFTDRPQIHSGKEHFAIEEYVLPEAVPEIPLEKGETRILIPFKDYEGSAYEDILSGLRELGPHTLLFLREIEEISWGVDDGSLGRYSRVNTNAKKRNVRKVLLTGEDDEGGVKKEEWLVFSRRVYSQRKNAGQVEIAFELNTSSEGIDKTSIRKVDTSPLVVFFPTDVLTNLGFLVQGPYRTTPSRDNVPEDDTWNRYLVEETAKLLVDAIKQLREFNLLDGSAIQCLPMEPPDDPISIIRNPNARRFAPLLKAVKHLLMTEPFLPAYKGGHIAGERTKLAGSQDLRDLISVEQLTELYHSDGQLGWLSEEITRDKSPEVHKYLTSELDIDEVTPESFIRRLSLNFLEAQSDEWMQRLYEFLNGQRALQQRLKSIPLLRMEDGSHAQAFIGEKPNAYLPGDTPTEFSTVKQSVCQSEEALEFLKALGLRVPDPVDDVIENLLPKYRSDEIEVRDSEYQDDIERILNAHDTDSTSQKNRLLSALKAVKFLIAVDAGNGESHFVCPSDAYMATDRLTDFFKGVAGVLLVDNSRECLRGERIRNLLRAVGAPEYLHPVEIAGSLTYEEKRKLREDYWISHPWLSKGYTREISENDYELRGLDMLLEVLTTLGPEQATDRANTLWDALRDVQNRGRGSPFMGKYTWLYYSEHPMSFPAKFVKMLNDTAWVPNKDGALHIPSDVSFKDTGWAEDSYLLSRIEFKPAVIDELAREAGIELGVIDFLKRHGITEAQLREQFGVPEEAAKDSEAHTSGTVSGQAGNGQEPKDSSENGTPGSYGEPKGTDSDVSDRRTTGSIRAGQDAVDSPTGETDKTKAGGHREFISYIAVNPDESSEKSGGLSHEERISLEDKAIDVILEREPSLRRTKTNNPGFDLMELGDEGEIVRFIEVKAMSGTLQDRPATLTKKQFECAQEERDAYWLYIVENSSAPKEANIVKINDPAGWAKTFTFDYGWKEVSQDSTHL